MATAASWGADGCIHRHLIINILRESVTLEDLMPKESGKTTLVHLALCVTGPDRMQGAQHARIRSQQRGESSLNTETGHQEGPKGKAKGKRESSGT